MRVSIWTIAAIVALRLAFVAGTSIPAVHAASAAPQTTVASAGSSLLPQPRSMVVLPGGGFEIQPQTEYLAPADLRVREGMRRMVAAIGSKTGQRHWSVVGAPARSYVTVSYDREDSPVQNVDEDESYTIDVSPRHVVIRGDTPVGALRGMRTFVQLIQPNSRHWSAPSVHIDDSPRFQWRGLMIDCSRHFIPVDVIKRNLDLMEQCKLNVFHWHLSDDQGFRVESKVFPRLQQYGSDGQYYTQAQIKNVIAYARDRGIRVVPEFDMPGHATAWFVGYPDLSSGPGPYAIERRFGIFDPAMDPTRESTYVWLDKFIGEMAALFPDRWFHIGGDEVNGKQWDGNPRIQEFMRRHSMAKDSDLQAYFNTRVQQILARHGKEMIGWDEVLNPALPAGVAIQSWRGQSSLAEAARMGHQGILSSGYYLNTLKPAATYYANDPQSGDASALTPAERDLIIGGEACMWGEEITGRSVTGRIWPRAAAIAERLWSPASVADPDSLNLRIAQFDPRANAPESPFRGIPLAIPGIFQSADFDTGGEGTAYHSEKEYNAGREYRPDANIGVGPCSDASGGYELEYLEPGEWVRYTVDVARAGVYDVAVRVATADDGRKFHFERADGTPLGPDIDVPTTGDWQKWTTVTGQVALPAGRQVITFFQDTGGCNIGTLQFTPQT